MLPGIWKGNGPRFLWRSRSHGVKRSCSPVFLCGLPDSIVPVFSRCCLLRYVETKTFLSVQTPVTHYLSALYQCPPCSDTIFECSALESTSDTVCKCSASVSTSETVFLQRLPPRHEASESSSNDDLRPQSFVFLGLSHWVSRTGVPCYADTCLVLGSMSRSYICIAFQTSSRTGVLHSRPRHDSRSRIPDPVTHQGLEFRSVYTTRVNQQCCPH